MGTPPIFFVHVMKTGGTSVGRMMRSQFPEEDTYPELGCADFNQRKLMIPRLLARPAEDRGQTRFHSLHMPAWVANEVAPDALHVSVLREPVARTVSHLRHIARAIDAPDLETLYDDPTWRDRLSNYQTHLFSERRSAFEEQQNARREALRQALARAAEGNDRSEEAGAPQVATEQTAPGPRDMLGHFMYTAIASPRRLTSHDLAAAVEMVDSFDLVGVTEHSDEFSRRLSRILEVPLGVTHRFNAAPDAFVASPELRARIGEDNPLDLELYRHVLSRYAAPD